MQTMGVVKLNISITSEERRSLQEIERRLGVRASRAIAIAIQHTLVDLRNRKPLNQVEPGEGDQT